MSAKQADKLGYKGVGDHGQALTQAARVARLRQAQHNVHAAWAIVPHLQAGVLCANVQEAAAAAAAGAAAATCHPHYPCH